MSILDWIVCLVALLAVWNGFRQGLVVQIGALVGIVAGIWLAARCGATVGSWLGLESSVAAAGGFATVLIVAVLAVAVAARLLRKAFRLAGLGVWDVVLGIAVALLKYLLLLSVLFSAFDTLNRDYAFVDERTLDRSKCYRPMLKVSEALFPVVERLREQLPTSGGEERKTTENEAGNG